ncbi:hypothetical protein ACO34A_06935 [Rhizobium sp. ACO-34A]|nr:peptidoglycan-binding domain-containing protein [Rhizobium sp. ACO-34A]ATN33541.1 hypothetical protein ACO34A_06935 [Rhizobium sp. ACO-34A]
MTKRKQKSPERKPASRVPGLLSAGFAALARGVSRHPRLIGGVASFAVAFGFVAANALWYQPGRHPSPIFRTRDAADFNALAGVARNPMQEQDPGNTTTFKIERAPAEGEQPPADAEPVQQAQAPLPSGDLDGDGVSELAVAVQTELSRRGLYAGDPDGVIGPQTEAAISLFQKSVGMEPSGLVSDELLAALRVDNSATAAVPKQRPPADVSSAQATKDPVAAAIRSAEKVVTTAPTRPVAKPETARAIQPKPVQPRPAPLNSERPTPPAAIPASADANDAEALPAALTDAPDPGLVMEIQRGLSNIAYTDVSIDGVAGDQTRAAIRRFQRHYRLPENGEPNAAVLKKLKDIGAL